MSRIERASKNIKYGYLGTLLTLALKFISRTVFIYTIGVTYLGVNGLYTNILSVLSFAELGIGTAMNYSLYKPIAENNVEKIKALMFLYKKAYRWIALVVSFTGLFFIPFLSIIVKDPTGISLFELRVFYLIFLFNTVSSYFVSYKYSLVNADQKNYIETSIRTMSMIFTTIMQVLVLYFLKSFLIYLIVAALVELGQKIFANTYINKRYPYLLDKEVNKLSPMEIKNIKRDIKALVYHKIGEISVHQTDNIIISSFINVTTVGIVSNYTLIITSITSLINVMFNSIVSSFGNLIATEDVNKQFKMFKVYRFVGFWFYGFATSGFLILINPLIQIWLGPNMLISRIVVCLILVDYYFKGHRIVINNFKIAAGVFDADKHIAIIQSIVNLVISILMVRIIGLPGIYIGTIIQGLVSTFTKPVIVYKRIFQRSSKEYYKDSLIYLSVLCLSILILEVLKRIILIEITISSFIIMSFLVLIVPNLVFMVFLRNREEFIYLRKLILGRFKKQK